MYRIRIFCPFAPSEKCIDICERIYNTNAIEFYGPDKKIYFTCNDDYTHAIILNTMMPALNIPKEKVIGLAFEPLPFLRLNTLFIEYAKKHIGKYYIGDRIESLPELFIENFGFMWHSTPKDIRIKNNVMSIIVSNKMSAPGHMYRHKLIKKIIELNLPIDIFGYGSTIYNYNRIKGKFNDSEPYDDYMFTISIENYCCKHYFSEKVTSPILLNCVPLYVGCLNIHLYLDGVILLFGDIDKDIQTIIKVLENPNKYYQITHTDKNIKSVNLIYNIEKLFESNSTIDKNCQLTNDDTKKQISL